ncbi:hypothetical protein VPH35_081698 [Triticum aestivum]
MPTTTTDARVGSTAISGRMSRFAYPPLFAFGFPGAPLPWMFAGGYPYPPPMFQGNQWDGNQGHGFDRKHKVKQGGDQEYQRKLQNQGASQQREKQKKNLEKNSVGSNSRGADQNHPKDFTDYP